MVRRWNDAGLGWSTALNDSELEVIMYSPSTCHASDGPDRPALPEWKKVHQELKRRDCHMTLNLLWKEYKAADLKAHFGYSWFGERYRAWSTKLEPVMRQTYSFGEKCFVDFAGDTLAMFVLETGKIQQAQVFVGTLGTSNYTYCDVCWSQDLPNWIRLHVDMFHFFGGCPTVLVPDNLKSGVTKARVFQARHPDIPVIFVSNQSSMNSGSGSSPKKHSSPISPVCSIPFTMTVKRSRPPWSSINAL